MNKQDVETIEKIKKEMSAGETVNKTKTLGYRLGQFFALVVTACVSSVVIGLTVKLLCWMFRL